MAILGRFDPLLHTPKNADFGHFSTILPVLGPFGGQKADFRAFLWAFLSVLQRVEQCQWAYIASNRLETSKYGDFRPI